MQEQKTGRAAIGMARDFRRRIGSAMMLDAGLRGFAAGALASGACGLALRLLRPETPVSWIAAAMAATSAIAGAAAALFARRGLPSLASCIASLDAASCAGGLYMVSGEEGADEWSKPEPQPPAVKWRGGGAVAGAAIGAAFAVTVAALPDSVFVKLINDGRLSIETLVQKELERAERLEEERLLPEQLAKEMAEELERISQTGDAQDPSRTLDALDHIAEEMKRMAADQAEEAAVERAALQAANALAEALAESAETGSMTDAEMTAAAQAMSELLASLPLPPELASNLLSAAEVQSGELSKEAMEKLSQMLKDADAMRAMQLSSLSDMKMIDPSMLKQCEGGSCSGGGCTNGMACAASLADMLAEGGDSADAAAAVLALMPQGMPGSGGVTRGRADAALTWSGGTTADNAAFKDEALTPGKVAGMDNSQFLGVSASAPVVGDAASAVAPGALSGGGDASGAVAQGAVLPRHRSAVKEYFNEGNTK